MNLSRNKIMDKNAKIYIAGHRGLVGSAIWKNLTDKGYTNLVGRTHAELDLLDSVAVKDFFDKERPDYVVLAAAHVGGIMANNTYRADFIYEIISDTLNCMINLFNITKIDYCHTKCTDCRNRFSTGNQTIFLTTADNIRENTDTIAYK